MALKIHISFLFIYFCIIFLHTNLPYFVKRPRVIVIDWALHKYFYYYYYCDSCHQSGVLLSTDPRSSGNPIAVIYFSPSIKLLYPSHKAPRERWIVPTTRSWITSRLLREFYNTLCSGHTARLLHDSFMTD